MHLPAADLHKQMQSGRPLPAFAKARYAATEFMHPSYQNKKSHLPEKKHPWLKIQLLYRIAVS